jgi:hypothetical protein
VQNLLAKLDTKMSANLEQAEGGQNFRLIDPARPRKPISPTAEDQHDRHDGGAGFRPGADRAAQYQDSSFTSDDEVTRLLSLPVLAVVPVMQSKEARQRSARRRMFVSLVLGSRWRDVSLSCSTFVR